MPAAPALTLDGRLADAADVLADDMAANDFFSHTGSDGSTPFTRISDAGYRWDVAAENIAAGPTSVQAVVDGWYASPTHCTNFMNPSVSEVGFARATDPSSTYGTYWVADLADPA
jgi:uncharacterized protein YkwD